MNCFNHPSIVAVAQCIDCGKGLCAACAKKYTITICSDCNDYRRNQSLSIQIRRLLISLGIFIAGYLLLGQVNGEPFLCGYVAASVFYGWGFVNCHLPAFVLIGSWAFILVVFVIKLFLSCLIGFFLFPYLFLRNIVQLIKILCIKA